MKILVIGDLHGHDTWKQIISENVDNFDKVVFVGDYLDSRSIGLETQLKNLLEIIEYKKSNIDNTVLLIGNHEYHYFKNIDEQYPGYNFGYSFSFKDVLEQAYKDGLINITYKQGDYIFSHAGISKTWCLNNNINYDNVNLDEEINELFRYNRQAFRIILGASWYGNGIYQSPIWIRPESLYKDSVDLINVIGHTAKYSVKITDKYILTDSLPYEYIILDTETNNHEIKKL